MTLEQEFAAQGLEIQRLRREVEDLRLRLYGAPAAERAVWRSLGVPLRDVPVLDRPHQDRILRRYRLFEPEVEGFRADARMYFDAAGARRLAALGERSPTGRCVIHGCVVEVEDRQTDGGHPYRVLRFDGVPEPEMGG